MKRIIAFVAGLCAGAAVAAAGADGLTVGVQQEPTSVDPHFHNNGPNNQIAQHIFDSLVGTDEKQRPFPSLAESWKPISETTWELKLRKGIKFQDGTPFTADDVVFTFERAPNVPNSPGSFGLFIRGKKAVKVDDTTVHVSTAEPYPRMIIDLGNFVVLSRKHGQGATTEDYNSGKAAIGTGPYRLERFQPGVSLTLKANPDYWGAKPKWDAVTFRLIKSDPSRVAALLAGDVDLIDHVPTTDITKLRQNPAVHIDQVPSIYVVFLSIDSNRDVTPFVRANDGSEIIPNPLRDQRVRRAISKAVNRAAIVDRVMEGNAEAAGQIVQEGFEGYHPDLKPEAYDPDGAKKLLAQAGFPDGFRLTLHSPNDRYINDAKIAEAVAQMLTRVGIKTELTTYPRSVFFSRATSGGDLKTPEFSIYLTAMSARSGEASEPLMAVLGTFNPQTSFGTNNRGRYSNVRFDARLDAALKTIDDEKRIKLLQEAQKIAVDDGAYVPLHFQVNTWAMRKGLTYKARTDERTLSEYVDKAR